MFLLEDCHQVFSLSPAQLVSDVNRNRLLFEIQELHRIVTAEFEVEATNLIRSGPGPAQTVVSGGEESKKITKAVE